MFGGHKEEKDPSVLLDQIKQELFLYLNRRLKLLKLNVFEKAGIISSHLGYIIIVFSIVCAIFFFALFTLAFFLGELLDSQWLGFGILTAFSILLLVLVLLFGKKMKSFLLNRTIVFFQHLELADKDQTEKEVEDGTRN